LDIKNGPMPESTTEMPMRFAAIFTVLLIPMSLSARPQADEEAEKILAKKN
jgi:hypothetical protein